MPALRLTAVNSARKATGCQGGRACHCHQTQENPHRVTHRPPTTLKGSRHPSRSPKSGVFWACLAYLAILEWPQ